MCKRWVLRVSRAGLGGGTREPGTQRWEQGRVRAPATPRGAGGEGGEHPPVRGIPWERRGPSSPAHDAKPLCQPGFAPPNSLHHPVLLFLAGRWAPILPAHPVPAPHRNPGTRCYSWRGDGHGFPPSRLIELSAEPNFPGDLTPSSPSAERSRSNRGAWPELSGRLEDGTVLPSSELAAPRGNCAPLHAQPGKEPRMGAASPRMRVDGRTEPRQWASGLLAVGVVPGSRRGEQSRGVPAACPHPHGGRDGMGLPPGT